MNKHVSFKEKASFVMANIGNIPIQTLISSYLLIFYTNIVGLSPASCATLFLIARILDGLNDPIVGFVIDHLPTTRYGHFRPSLMVGTVLCSLNFLLLWFGPMMAPSGKLLIAYVSYLLIGVLFPVMDISLNSLLPVMTGDFEERNKLSSLKGFAYNLGSVILGMSAPIILANTNESGGYVRLILIATAVTLVFSLVGAAGVKEHVQAEANSGNNKYKITDLIKIMTRKPILVTFVCNLVYYVGTVVFQTTNAYFYTYIIGNLTLMSLTSLVSMVTLLGATVLSVKLIPVIGKKKLYVIGLLTFGILPLVRLFNITSIPLLIVATAIQGVGAGLYTPLAYGIQADNTDFIELELGYRAEGAVASLSSFITKFAMGVGGAIPGYLLAIVGFDSSAPVQSAMANAGIIGCITIAPAIAAIIGSLVFGTLYPITKEKLEEQSYKLQQLREKNRNQK